MKTVDFSETIAASYIQKFKLDFLRNYFADLNQILDESFQVQGNETLMT